MRASVYMSRAPEKHIVASDIRDSPSFCNEITTRLSVTSQGVERTLSGFWRRGGWARLLVGQGTSGGAGFRGRGGLDGLPGDVRAGAALRGPVGDPGEEAR